MTTAITQPAVIIGTNDFTEQPSKLSYEKQRGWYLTRTYEGPQELSDTFQASLIAQYNPDSLTRTRGVPCVIVITIPVVVAGQLENQRAVDEAHWERIQVRLERDLATHPIFHESGGTTLVLELIDAAIKKGTSASVDWNTRYSYTKMNDYRDLRLCGVHSYIAWSWLIRNTVITQNAGDLRFPDLNNGVVIAYNEIGVPQAARWDTPKMKIGSWAGLNFAYTETDIKEWLQYPVDQQVRLTKGLKRHEFKREWHGAEWWSNGLYPRSAAAGVGKLIPN